MLGVLIKVSSIKFFSSLVNGYQEIRPLTEDEKKLNISLRELHH